MLRLEPRPEPSRAMSIASPLIALAITVVIGTLLFVLLGKDPLRGLAVFFVFISTREVWLRGEPMPPRIGRSARWDPGRT